MTPDPYAELRRIARPTNWPHYLVRFHAGYIPEPNSGCWLWDRDIAKNGYGRISINNKRHFSHRISWEVFRGAVPDGLCVLHKCDVRCCVNPDHLFLGTYHDNVVDMMKKGRAGYKNALGEHHKRSKLTNVAVREIRATQASAAVLARKHGVSEGTIRSVRRRETWGHQL